MTAVGPFTTTDSLDLQPLRDLLELVQRDRPHVLILVGVLALCLCVYVVKLFDLSIPCGRPVQELQNASLTFGID